MVVGANTDSFETVEDFLIECYDLVYFHYFCVSDLHATN